MIYFSRMRRSFALFMSFLVHPAIMPMIGVALILLFAPYHISRPVFLLVIVYVFLGTYFFPLLMALLFKKLKLISSIHLDKASERRYPYLFTALFFYLTAQSMRNFPVPEMVSKYLMAGVIILAVSLVVLSISKLSAHMAGIGGVLGLLIFISYQYNMGLLPAIILVLLMSGFLGSARLILKAHTPSEIYLGYLLGFGSVYSGLYFI